MTKRQLASATQKSNRSPRGKRPAGHRESGHKRRQKLGSADQASGVSLPEGLRDAIETERGNLSTAESLLGCMATSMEYEADPVNGPYYPDVARLARDLLRQSINGLDSLSLKKHLLRDKVKEDSSLPIELGSSIAAEGDTAIHQSTTAYLSMAAETPMRVSYAAIRTSHNDSWGRPNGAP
jgi:hypothetical protein